MTRRSVLLLALATLIPVSLYVLHDPPWIAGSTYGFFPVEADQDGRAFRWTGGRASFFVPESAVSITLELAGHAVYDVTVTISIDGRMADRVVLEDGWRTVTLEPITGKTSRRYRRIDLHCNRVIGDDFLRGVKVRWPISGSSPVSLDHS